MTSRKFLLLFFTVKALFWKYLALNEVERKGLRLWRLQIM